MPHLDIKVHRCNEKEPVFSEVQPKAELELQKAAILEAGMASGEPSVTFFLKDPSSGEFYMAQTSVGILNMLMSAINGAKGHWAENPVENIWK